MQSHSAYLRKVPDTQYEQMSYADEYYVFLIRDGADHWYVEMTLANALHRHADEQLGYRSVELYLDDMGPIIVSVVPPGQTITIKDDDGTSITKQAREWAIEQRGLLCSTSR